MCVFNLLFFHFNFIHIIFSLINYRNTCDFIRTFQLRWPSVLNRNLIRSLFPLSLHGSTSPLSKGHLVWSLRSVPVVFFCPLLLPLRTPDFFTCRALYIYSSKRDIYTQNIINLYTSKSLLFQNNEQNIVFYILGYGKVMHL